MAENTFDFSEEANLTNQQLAGELARLAPLSQDEISRLLPRRVDKEQFAQLLQIVNSASSQNNKVAELRANIETLGSVVLKLLTKYLGA